MTVRSGASCALLAEQLYVDPGDVAVIVQSLGLDPAVEVPYEWLGHVHDILDPHNERTVSQAWQPAGGELPRLVDPRSGPIGEVEWPEL